MNGSPARIECSRESIVRLLRSDAHPELLRTRAASLEARADNIVRFVGWPALVESLRADIDALRDAASTRSAALALGLLP